MKKPKVVRLPSQRKLRNKICFSGDLCNNPERDCLACHLYWDGVHASKGTDYLAEVRNTVQSVYELSLVKESSKNSSQKMIFKTSLGVSDIG